MEFGAMRTFLSEENIKRHLSHLRTLRLRLSILEKSVTGIKGKSQREILSMSLSKAVKREIIPLLANINLHEAYFSSFSAEPRPSELVKKYHGSESSLCYKMKEAAKTLDHGFLYVFKDQRGRCDFGILKDLEALPLQITPILSVDLYEHAYFSDYGYDYESYLKGALSHLDFSKLAR